MARIARAIFVSGECAGSVVAAPLHPEPFAAVPDDVSASVPKLRCEFERADFLDGSLTIDHPCPFSGTLDLKKSKGSFPFAHQFAELFAQ